MKPHLYILLSLLFFYADLFPQRVTIHHIDVAQGDATLIRTSNGKAILIDAGDKGKGEDVILPYLQSFGITSIDYLIASHYHADHIGAIDEIVQGLSPDSIRTVLDRGSISPLPTSKAFRQYWSAAQTTARHQTVYLGQSIKLTDELSLQCLAVDGAVLGRGGIKGSKGDENNRSIAWLLSSEHTEGGKNFSFRYFTGGDCGGVTDAYADLETPLASVVGDVDAMKINHHESRYSTNRTFLDSLRPEAVVISVGDRNTYHHPTQETLDRLQSTTSVRYIYQTESGNGGTAPNEKIMGTVTISLFDSFFTIGADTFHLQSRPTLRNQSVNSIVPTPGAPAQNLISATVEGDLLTLNLLEGMDISLKLFNILGQEVHAQPGRRFPPGTHQIHLFDAYLPAGVYLVRITTPSGVLTKKAILLR
ncbi:MAG: MBL fold metallo-hydrolase [Ignavibacteria bacterium]|nr:MBL fold metallo-hydrolase [Ignavibacteria bacterium]